MGLLFALAMAFSWLESLVVVPGLIPGIRLGLSNIVTMFCLFWLGGRSAYTLAVLKALFVLLTRGPVAGGLSLSGGVLSITVMLLFARCRRMVWSYLSLSMLGAIAHNLGQLLLARYITNLFLYYYIPVLLVSGAAVGVITGILYQALMRSGRPAAWFAEEGMPDRSRRRRD